TTGLMAIQDKPHRTCVESNRAPDVVQEPRGLSRSNTALK
ncbi:hypothetical protein DBR06_SOUSAS6810076, partial [Sousa chinensis]